MKLHELTPAKGSRKTRKRIGRGHGAGQGKTSGRGQKGQGSRSSVGLPTGFEGGQMPLKQRLPEASWLPQPLAQGVRRRQPRQARALREGHGRRRRRAHRGRAHPARLVAGQGARRRTSDARAHAAGRSDLGCRAHRGRGRRRERRARRPAAGIGDPSPKGRRPPSGRPEAGRQVGCAAEPARRLPKAEERSAQARRRADAPRTRDTKAAGRVPASAARAGPRGRSRGRPEPDGAPDNEAETEDTE